MLNIVFCFFGLLAAFNFFQLKKGMGTPWKNGLQMTAFFFLCGFGFMKPILKIDDGMFFFIVSMGSFLLEMIEAIDMTHQNDKRLGTFSSLITCVPFILVTGFICGLWH